MSESYDDLHEYRNNMEAPLENLAMALGGVDTHHLMDAQIVEVAAKKLTMLREMLLASGMNENLLKAAMKS